MQDCIFIDKPLVLLYNNAVYAVKNPACIGSLSRAERKRWRFMKSFVRIAVVVPAFLGFILLFGVNFLIILSAVLLLAVGLLTAPVGTLYAVGLIPVVSDLSPFALASMGFACLFAGITLSFFVFRFSPWCVKLLHKFGCWEKKSTQERIYVVHKKRALLWVFLSLALAFAALTVFLQYRDGTGSVTSETLYFDVVRYVKITTTNLDVDVRYYDGDKIKVEYVNDSPIFTERADENYLRLVQDDSFTLSLFAMEQLNYRLTLWLPDNDYREIYITSSGGSVYLESTQSEYTEITTKNGSVTIAEASEKLAVNTVSGNVDCNYIAFVTAGTFTSKSGDISITMPEFSGVTLEYVTQSGYFVSDFFSEKYDGRYGSLTLDRESSLSHYLYVTTESGGLELKS